MMSVPLGSTPLVPPPHKRSQPSAIGTGLERMRAATDSEISSTHAADADIDYPAHKARLYQLFTLIEKEFDRLYIENMALRARAGISDPSVDIGIPIMDLASEGPKTGSKPMQMGQKLRTALGKRPQGRLVFKVGGSDTQRFKLDRTYDGHRDGVWQVSTSTGPGIIVSASADQTARVWSLESSDCIGVYTGHSGSVNAVSIAPPSADGTSEALIATASGDESAHIWKMPLPAPHSDRGPSSMLATADSEEKDDEDAPVLHEDGSRRVSTPLIRLTGHTGVVSACEWTQSASQLVTASWDRTANIYDVERGEVINILSGHEDELTSCSTHPWQKLVVTASKDCTFRLWDLREPMQSVAVLQAHNHTVTSVAFSTTDKIVSASDDRTLKVWEVRNMRSPFSTMRLRSPPNGIAVNRWNSFVAAPLDNAHVVIYDINGQRLLDRRCHTRMATSVSWTDGNSLVSGGFDRLLHSWKITIKEKDEKA